jgi:hypothetical protein
MITFTEDLPSTNTFNQGETQVIFVQVTSDNPDVVSFDFKWYKDAEEILDWRGNNVAAFQNVTAEQYQNKTFRCDAVGKNSSGVVVDSGSSTSMLVTVIVPPPPTPPGPVAGRSWFDHFRLRLLGYI